ncbi:NAD-dependent epimerase/dehydratase family protein [Flavobacteriaceae bacterium]|nr:NAD-dependent epimerase/dehydratase family protein [Flavobacteriaceae bacterium]
MKNKIIEDDILDITNEIPGDHFSNKTVLISGASGFLASYITYYFLYLNKINKDQNTKVIGLVRNIKKANLKFNQNLNDKNFHLIEHDVNNFFEYQDEIHFIFHAASQASPKYYKTDPIGTLLPNTQGTINLLNLACKKKTECFLFFSSGEIYGNSSSKHIKENNYGVIDPLDIRSCYGLSKKMGENICLSYHNQKNANIKIVRPFHIYGPGMPIDDGRVQADFINKIIKKENLEITSDGKAVRSFCYIKDAIIAFLLISLKGENVLPYNVGNKNEIYDIKTLASTLIENCCDYQAKIIFKDSSRNYLKSSLTIHAPNTSRMEALGWQAKTNIVLGFKRTINSYNK